MPRCHAYPDVGGCFFSKAAAVNLSFPEQEGRRGRAQLTSSHLLAQENSSFKSCSTGGARHRHKELGVSAVSGTSLPALITGGVVQFMKCDLWSQEFSSVNCLVEDGDANPDEIIKILLKKLNLTTDEAKKSNNVRRSAGSCSLLT